MGVIYIYAVKKLHHIFIQSRVFRFSVKATDRHLLTFMVYQTTVIMSLFFYFHVYTGWPDLYILTTPLAGFFYSKSPWQLCHGCHMLVFHPPLLSWGSIVVDLEELGRSRWPPLKMKLPPHLHHHYHHQGGPKWSTVLLLVCEGWFIHQMTILIKTGLILWFSSTCVLITRNIFNFYIFHERQCIRN